MTGLPLSTRILIDQNKDPQRHLGLLETLLINLMSESERKQLYQELFVSSSVPDHLTAQIIQEQLLRHHHETAMGLEGSLLANLAYHGFLADLKHFVTKPQQARAAMIGAAIAGQTGEILSYLLSMGGGLQITPVMVLAVSKGHLDFIKELVRQGAITGLKTGYLLLVPSQYPHILEYLASLEPDSGRRNRLLTQTIRGFLQSDSLNQGGQLEENLRRLTNLTRLLTHPRVELVEELLQDTLTTRYEEAKLRAFLDGISDVDTRKAALRSLVLRRYYLYRMTSQTVQALLPYGLDLELLLNEADRAGMQELVQFIANYMV